MLYIFHDLFKTLNLILNMATFRGGPLVRPFVVKVRKTQLLKYIFLEVYQDLLFDAKYGYIHRLTPFDPFKGGWMLGVN